MKKNRIYTLLTIILGVLALYIYAKPVYNLLSNLTLDYTKEVYLGGDNIVLDYLATNEDNTVSAVSEYATVGTITFIDKDGNFGAVGHSLDQYGFDNGNIYITPVDSVIKNNAKHIGEKNVIVDNWTKSGSIYRSDDKGVFGEFLADLSDKKILEVGMPKDIEKGEALLYTNVIGNEVRAYKVEIERVFYMRESQNIYIKVVDEELLKQTGGVIQGMSGSPIVQDGKIIGSLSHVDDKNPEYGYGLFITYMI